MGVLQRVVGAVLGLAFFIAVFIFASFVIGALLAVGLVTWAWLWWRTRSLRKAARGDAVIEGEVIDGEYTDVTRYDYRHDRSDGERRIPPPGPGR
jgi:hypothetical protein